MESIVEISESTEITSLVLNLKDDVIRRFAGGVVIPSGRSHVTFNIDEHKDITTHMMQRYGKDTYSHAFGAVFGPGTTVLRGPYSYAIVVVASLEGAMYKVNEQDPKSCNLIHAQRVECTIQVASGQLMAMVFAWRS
ncbi:hypothetical protein COCC4DRAFT_64965 [Bipolaris maydis ATCC 48331]|uniref:Uncharacterized protein n=2 Tax=Cochliobolus heterostrophus TaxID=5016 RepID=M2U9L1_COCH5|nr:uncharacterized protein COCC4DRAFT_64965 [Bipolaris maydis ATCC 48331]EMD95269.1 hypothetical protein COCHEDRAFT_1090828 [Bipolaris maydis C5]ENI00839.1 hypothetical protein COCC4DRAFT_64965 [Bipolaris maydis ATCC 48331]KAJ6214281.1 hypothetical protein PSV09DRAFT_1090828 [Bipolaris maydis]